MAERAAWTWMVYMAGDNDLSSAGEADLAQLRRVGSSPQVHVLVQLDAAGQVGTRRMRVGRDGVGEEVLDLGETDSGSPETLVDFARWAAAHYPAERYALVLWNHGGGWEPSEIERVAAAAGGSAFAAGEAPLRSATGFRRAFFRPTLARLLAGSPRDRAICSDDGSGHSLDTVELGAALAQIAELLGQPIDLLGMDACLMSTFEIACQVAPHARVLVASEETEPASGWPYEQVLAPLAANPALTSVELGALVVDAYLDAYAGNPAAGELTQTALDLSRLGDLMLPLDELVAALLAEMPADGSWMWAAQRRAPSFWDGSLRDVLSLCRGLEGRGERVHAAARALRLALAPGPGRAVIADRRRGEKVERCGGLSIYLPSGGQISRYYEAVEFARKTQWLAFLRRYIELF